MKGTERLVSDSATLCGKGTAATKVSVYEGPPVCQAQRCFACITSNSHKDPPY